MNSKTGMKIFLDAGPGQERLGFFDSNNKLVEVWFNAIHRPNFIGSIHRVRISQVFEKQYRASASLVCGTMVSIRIRKSEKAIVKQGKTLIITITAAPRDGKPWQAIPGGQLFARDMILLAGIQGSKMTFQLSSKIDQKNYDDLKKSLFDTVSSLLPNNLGIKLLNDCLEPDNFRECVIKLMKDWDQELAEMLDINSESIRQIYSGGGLKRRALRLYPEAELIEEDSFSSLSKDWFDGVEAIDKSMDLALSSFHKLPHGGHLWLQRTNALWAVDVDGEANNNFRNLSLTAAREIADQIRLRGVSGPVFIDLPRLNSKENVSFVKALKAHLAESPRRPKYLGRTRGRLFELWVPHGEMALVDIVNDQPAQSALFGLRMVARERSFKPVKLAVSQSMADWLNAAGKPALESVDRPLTLEVWSSDDDKAVPWIVD